MAPFIARARALIRFVGRPIVCFIVASIWDPKVRVLGLGAGMLPAKNRHPAPSFVNPPSGQLLEFTSKEISQAKEMADTGFV